MTTIHFTLKDGSTRAVDAKDGQSVMLAAINGNVRGIDAECGGSCSCATCHVYVDPDFHGGLAPPDGDEEALLDATAAPRQPTSRLSCQIVVGPELEGLVLRVPPTQV
ncbi:MAG: 2Fe-2S iron-sulfur cluster-binding protein [Candidatus Protistobacter heckmanni]|nr:2Fe-2S iron-sulfur cluster-binding protein [Candidatus Protistobacter heckmanni]